MHPATLPPVSRRAALEGAIEMCGSCRFWHLANAEDMPQGKAAACRRFPPTAVLMTTMEQSLVSGGQPRVRQGPGTVPTITRINEWCGEFQARIVPTKP